MSSNEDNLDEHARLSDLPAVPLARLNLHDQPTPPKVYPRLNTRLRIAMWLMLIGGPVVVGMGLYEMYRVSQLKSVGQQVEGKLHDSAALNTGKGRVSYQLVVDYLPPGSDTMYRKTFVVDEATHEQARQANACTVTYLPSDPTISQVGDNPSTKSEPLAMGGGLLAIAAVIWLFLRKQERDVQTHVTAPLGEAP